MKPLRGIAGTLLIVFSYNWFRLLVRHLGLPNEPGHELKIFTDLVMLVVMLFAGVVLILDARPGGGPK
ncbi:MAG: hypothetical protein QOE70_3206 [Chthoniobacter sp.]|jgi:hypothetical protein|nr:hypothetical protein [Chthoniobacter sp.]